MISCCVSSIQHCNLSLTDPCRQLKLVQFCWQCYPCNLMFQGPAPSIFGLDRGLPPIILRPCRTLIEVKMWHFRKLTAKASSNCPATILSGCFLGACVTFRNQHPVLAEDSGPVSGLLCMPCGCAINKRRYARALATLLLQQSSIWKSHRRCWLPIEMNMTTALEQLMAKLLRHAG